MNDTLLPNKMTKSYLIESDPYLKTSSKTSPFALNGDDGVYRVANVWNGHHSSAIPSEVISDRPTVKPLAMHNVPSNVPPIAYINGNSVRPVGCRHYSQQQTVFHAATANNNNNSDSEKNTNSGIKVAAGDMHHYAEPNENRVNENGGAGDTFARHESDRGSAANGSVTAPMTPQSPGEVRDQGPASSQPQHEEVESPSYQSPSSLRDFVTTNNENESSIYNLYENNDEVIQHLAKRIKDALRLAKESRQLVCNELLVPQLLTSHAAADVIEMAECEPGGLRGCQLFICIEDSGAALSQSRPRNKKSSLNISQQQQELLNEKLHSRRLGEVKFDRSVVPTFEVYLTLKRAAPNWLESLENKLLGKERVVLSELYLLHKKQLYLEPTM